MTGSTPAPAPAERVRGRGQLTSAAVSAGLALAWLGLSWWHPAVTYHFGPPLAAAAWPVLLRARLHHPARHGQALAAVSGGFLIALAALAVAIGTHWLRGPALIGRGSVPAEEAVLAVVACVWGWRVLSLVSFVIALVFDSAWGLVASSWRCAAGSTGRREL